MLIEKLRIINHPAIGTVDLDFRDETGMPARVVVIAGQNGAGKTVILEVIQSLFEQSFTLPCQVYADINLDDVEEERIARSLSQHVNGEMLDLARTIRVVRSQHSTLSVSHEEIGHGSAFGIDNGPNGFGLTAVFSPANVVYAGSDIVTITANEVDIRNLTSHRGGVEGTSIPQLLVSLEAQDASAHLRYARENPGVSPIGAVPSYLDRFRNAFALMFPSKILKSIEPRDGRYHIVFEEYGLESNIHQLSTGEKQIVYRASFLLRNAGVIPKSVILIDEPELSLSPDWQSKVLAFYAKSLTIGDLPHPQIICATHSPFVVHSASAGKVIVLQRTATGSVEAMPEPMFPEASPPVAVRAFNLDQFVRDIQPGGMTVLTEGETDHLILEAAWSKLYLNQPMPFRFRPGNGSGPLQSLLNSPALSTLTATGKIVGLFDFDDAWNQWNGVWKPLRPIVVSADDMAGCVKRHPRLPAWTMLLPVPAFRSTMASSASTFKGRSLLSIEFMFPNTAIPQHMFSQELQVGGVSLPKFHDASKREFAENVVGQIPATEFEAFRPLFDRLLEIQRAS